MSPVSQINSAPTGSGSAALARTSADFWRCWYTIILNNFADRDSIFIKVRSYLIGFVSTTLVSKVAFLPGAIQITKSLLRTTYAFFFFIFRFIFPQWWVSLLNIEDFIQKRRQMLSLLLGGQNFFNSLLSRQQNRKTLASLWATLSRRDSNAAKRPRRPRLSSGKLWGLSTTETDMSLPEHL